MHVAMPYMAKNFQRAKFLRIGHIHIATCILSITFIVHVCLLPTGYGLGDETVYLAFIVVIVWTIIFLTIACLGIHIKRF